MRENKRPPVNGWAILVAIIIGVPLLVVGYVAVQTWVPLQKAGKAFEMIDSLEARDSRDAKEVGSVALGLGGAALEITPFLARYFELRNDALLVASMGLQEYRYIYAVAYHDLLLSESTRNEIFSDDLPLSPRASEMLRQCLSSQLEELRQSGDQAPRTAEVHAELARMENDATRLIWQDGLPADVHASITPYREELDRLFCPATAGLEMERSSRRAIAVALE